MGTSLKRTVIDTVAGLGVAGVRSEVDLSNYKMKRLNAKLGIDGERDPDGSEYMLYGATIDVLLDDPSAAR